MNNSRCFMPLPRKSNDFEYDRLRRRQIINRCIIVSIENDGLKQTE